MQNLMKNGLGGLKSQLEYNSKELKAGTCKQWGLSAWRQPMGGY